MTDREITDALSAFAEKHGYSFAEEDTFKVQYDEVFATDILVGWDMDRGIVTYLACQGNGTCLGAELVEKFRHIRKVNVWANGQSLEWMGALRGITHLEIHGWNGEAMPESWACAGTLQSLYLVTDSGRVPDSIRSLRMIQVMGLSSEKTLFLPDWLSDLKRLKKLLAGKCRIHSIPGSVVALNLPFLLSGVEEKSEIGIFLAGSTLETGDIEFFARPLEKIKAVYQKKAMRQVRECKVIFLGDGDVGKTSLIDRMVDDHFDINQKTTDGCRMVPWRTRLTDGTFFTLRIMDFGGQEILHAMHRCFLTKHTVYVVVCESRNDTYIDAIAARWLETVKSFAPDCPVILALNKADMNPNVSVNEYNMYNVNPKLKLVLRTSAKVERDEPFGTDTLFQAISDAVPISMDTSEMDENWLGLKRELERMKEPYITADVYRNICEKHHISGHVRQQSLLERLGELGIVYSYEEENKDTHIRDFRILKPDWLTNGMYRLILRTPEAGFIPHEQITATLKANPHENDVQPAVTYTTEETEYILAVMRKFKISHNMGNGMEMVPMKMQKSPSRVATEFPRGEALHLRWSGNYLPDNLIHRLIISKYAELDDRIEKKDAVWRTGGRFRNKKTGVMALAEINPKGELDVYVYDDGDRTSRHSDRCRSYLESFRREILKILEDLNVWTTEMICFTMQEKQGAISLNDVMEQMYQKGEKPIYISGVQEYISPRPLLEDVYSKKKSAALYRKYQEEQNYQRGKHDLLSHEYGADSVIPENVTEPGGLNLKWLIPPILVVLIALLLLFIGALDIQNFLTG